MDNALRLCAVTCKHREFWMGEAVCHVRHVWQAMMVCTMIHILYRYVHATSHMSGF